MSSFVLKLIDCIIPSHYVYLPSIQDHIYSVLGWMVNTRKSKRAYICKEILFTHFRALLLLLHNINLT